MARLRMMSLLAVPAVLGWALHFHRRLPERPGAAIFLAVSGIVATIYAFACIGHLWIGAALLFHGGNIALLAYLWLDRSRALRFLGSVPCVVFGASGIAYGLAFSGVHYSYWDEFAQWGLTTREMVATHQLYDLTSNAHRPTAPPAAALWNFFVCGNTRYSEGVTYYANFLLLSSALLPLYDGLSFRKPGWVALVAALELLLLLNLSNGVAILYVDQLISCFFAGILLVHLAEPRSRRTIVMLAVPLFVLSLIKEAALFFAVGAALCIALHHLAAMASGIRPGIRGLTRDRSSSAALALVLVAPLLAVGSWQLRLASLENDGPTRSVWGTGARVLGNSDHASGFEARVVERFAEVFLEQPMSRDEVYEKLNAFSYPVWKNPKSRFRLSTLGYLICFVVVSCVAWVCTRGRDQKRAIELISGCLIAIFVVYVLALLRVYITDGERGTLLSSYTRYTNTALFPMMLIALAWFLPATTLARPEARSRMCGPVLLGIVVVLYAIETPNFAPLFSARRMLPFRASTQPETDRIVREIGAGHSLFVYLSPQFQTAPFQGLVLRYQLTPVSATVQASIRDDETLLEALDHDYLWIFSAAPELADRFRSAFGSDAPQSGVLYRIDRAPEAIELVLHPVWSRPTGRIRSPPPLLLRRAPSDDPG